MIYIHVIPWAVGNGNMQFYAFNQLEVQTDPAVPPEMEQNLLAANPELRGKSALEVLDAVIESCVRTSVLHFLLFR